jgi:drug/metabolite transporter (DMT)-like permease
VTVLYTSLALLAFASNSLLCRVALGEGSIDAASFTSIRLGSGALMLSAITSLRGVRLQPDPAGRWTAAFVLFLYAVTFSYAYVSLPVATGALVLFGAVQTMMLIAAIRAGERPRPLEWMGLLMAIAGLVYLVSPGLSAPPAAGAAMMAASGFAWGWYTLLGRRSADAIGRTTANFVRSVPFTVALSVAMAVAIDVTARGALLAAVSGAVTSGLGYVAWYAALPRLTAFRAAAVQLVTPILTATGGVLFLREAVSARLGLSAALILGGIAVVMFSRIRRR